MGTSFQPGKARFPDLKNTWHIHTQLDHNQPRDVLFILSQILQAISVHLRICHREKLAEQLNLYKLVASFSSNVDGVIN